VWCLDHLLAADSTVDLLKVDGEGAEYQVCGGPMRAVKSSTAANPVGCVRE
jgi:hypothetical protein